MIIHLPFPYRSPDTDLQPFRSLRPFPSSDFLFDINANRIFYPPRSFLCILVRLFIRGFFPSVVCPLNIRTIIFFVVNFKSLPCLMIRPIYLLCHFIKLIHCVLFSDTRMNTSLSIFCAAFRTRQFGLFFKKLFTKFILLSVDVNCAPHTIEKF